jgi:hypothetical protein
MYTGVCVRSLTYIIKIYTHTGYGDIRVTVEKVPDTVLLENTFEVVCRITNCW